jgi:hypothetical protein
MLKQHRLCGVAERRIAGVVFQKDARHRRPTYVTRNMNPLLGFGSLVASAALISELLDSMHLSEGQCVVSPMWE